MEIKKIVIGADHAGFEYKSKITEWLQSKNIEVQDFGTHSTDSVDYPDFAHPVAQIIQDQKADLGILICGSGNGVAMTANKHADVRAALCWNTELAELARQHNNANVLCIPARFVSIQEAEAMVQSFINTEFEQGRHQRRVQKISC